MANNKIQIKRSIANSTVTGLSNGELAFTQAGNILYIGSPTDGTSIRIAGLQVPGTLTANQALVANATSGIDKVITANLAANSIWANGSAGGAGEILYSNGTATYWAAAPTGDVTGVTAGAGLTGGGSSGDVTLDVAAGNGISVSTDAVAVFANSGLVANTTGLHILTPDTTLIANATGLYVNDATITITPSQINGDIALGTNTSGNYVASVAAANGISGNVAASEGAAPSLFVVANNGIVANSTGVWARAANGISVDAAGINVLGGSTGGLVVNSTGVWVNANNGLVANATGLHVGSGNGISVSADAIAVTGGSTITVNATGVHVNSTLGIQDLTVSGNLTVLGDLVSMNVATLAVEDSLITLAKDQGSTASFTDALDIGFVGIYGNTANLFYSGLFRDQSDTGTWKLFASNGAVTNTNVDTGTGFSTATLQAFLRSGGLTTNSTSANLIANSTYAVGIVANSLTLSTALAGTSGGTGKATMTSEAILVGNTSNGYKELTLGISGYVLQSNGSAIVYDTLDGGTF
jgi:hypothetical protein